MSSIPGPSAEQELEHLDGQIQALLRENEQLTLENWQLKGALGYPVPGDIPEGTFKCGFCETRRRDRRG